MARGGGRVGFSNSSGSPSAVESLDATMSPAASLECPEYLQYLDSTPDAPFARAWAVEVRNVPALDADETDATGDKRDCTCILIKGAPHNQSKTQQSDIHRESTRRVSE